MMWRLAWRALGLVVLSTVAACATPEVAALRADRGGLPARAEIAGVPFHPQQEQYCGPAALATVLGWSGLPATQEAVAAAVYTPGRAGTLGHDLVSTAARHGRLAVPVADLASLLREVAAGHPVLVLQNLGLGWYPQWHYTVVVGYDLAAGELALRSGEERRRVVSLDTFARTWARADRWAIVVLPPVSLPASASEGTVVRAAAGLERAGRAGEAALAYDAILRRWPGSLGALIGRGNARYATGDLDGAAVAYRAALARHPAAAVAWNNLADVLAARGQRDAALIAARRAVALGAPMPRPIGRPSIRSVAIRGMPIPRGRYDIEIAPGRRPRPTGTGCPKDVRAEIAQGEGASAIHDPSSRTGSGRRHGQALTGPATGQRPADLAERSRLVQGCGMARDAASREQWPFA